MKLLSIALTAALAAASLNVHASNNTYTYSNTEYCQLAASNSAESYLVAYSRKLGFEPTSKECEVLLSKNDQSRIEARQNVRKFLKEALQGSLIRPSDSLIRKLTDMPEQQRQQELSKFVG
ncbi:MAG TPA: hypothetical protein VIN66_11220 [Rheinheimera sp.]|uniref:hypothetical protein n=1 Tax=Rheinheimera sp. TaxID=1869214 RepID=UPI002F95E3BC